MFRKTTSPAIIIEAFYLPSHIMRLFKPRLKIPRLLLSCLLLSIPGCVRYDDDKAATQPNGSPLDEIHAQLDRPIAKQEKGEPTAKPEKKTERWRAYGNKNPDAETIQEQQRTRLAEVLKSQEEAPWPPQLGYHYPEILFLTANGEKKAFADFKGRPILVEYVSMKSSSSQALAGANEKGSFSSIPLNRNFQSLELYFPSYAGGINAGQIGLVQILLVNSRGGAVALADAQAWAKHFELEARGRTVLVGTSVLLRGEASQLLGGFQLLDKNLVVRGDATGERSKTLFSQVFPLIPRLAK